MSGASNSDPTANAYPEQRHAGKVGYGPNYHVGASFADKVVGLTDEVKGKIKHDPALIQHGHELMSGEEKRKELLGEKQAPPKKTDTKHKKQKGSKLKESTLPGEFSSSDAHIEGGSSTTSNATPRTESVSRSPDAEHTEPNQSHHAQTAHISKHDPIH